MEERSVAKYLDLLKTKKIVGIVTQKNLQVPYGRRS
jgi:hypothetical protein